MMTLTVHLLDHGFWGQVRLYCPAFHPRLILAFKAD